MKVSFKVLLLSTFISLSSASVFSKTIESSITFAKGMDQKTQTGNFKGYDDIQYKIYAKKGQTLKFKIESNSSLANVNIFAPGKKPGKDNAIFIGSNDGQEGEVTLPSNGEYTIQVYQMRFSARKNQNVDFKLNVKILNEDKSITKNFDAVGELPCSLTLGQPTTQCQFGVIRKGNGTAQLSVFSKENKEYLLNFENGKLISPRGKTLKRADLSLIELNTHERFEVPDAVIYGG